MRLTYSGATDTEPTTPDDVQWIALVGPGAVTQSGEVSLLVKLPGRGMPLEIQVGDFRAEEQVSDLPAD